MLKKILWSFALSILASCSPLRTSPHDERHQWELKLHEVQTSLDDVRHDINCFQTELQILDGRIKYYENALANLKQQDLEKQQAKLEQLSHQIQALEKKWGSFETLQKGKTEELEDLAAHANETTLALSQFKERIQELEEGIYQQNRRFEELAKVKGNLEILTKALQGSYKVYKVRPGDSLEKIARIHKTDVERIRQLNHLERDLIVVGQELKIPTN